MPNEKGAGRPRKPTALRGIDGGKAPKRGEPTEPQPEASVRKPPLLTRRAKEHWDKLAPSLIKQGVLTEWDVNLFAGYCEAAARFDAARKLVSQNGLLVPGQRTGTQVKNPMIQVQKDALDEMLRIGARFGLSPSDRAGLKVTPTQQKEGLAKFL